MSTENNSDFLSRENLFPLIAAGVTIIAAVVSLNWQGRVLWCLQGDMSPWSWQINSAHNSQHIIDAYSFTHILHGVLEFWLIGLVFRRVPLAWRFAIAILIESSWEVAENTAYVINRYREATISLDYFGDSIVNSMADIACCGVGFWIAYKLKFWRSLVLFLVTEMLLVLTVRDSLLINILMLIYPLDAIRHWQEGG